jgi:drug/metabolite transporter (DMT)-like permease
MLWIFLSAGAAAFQVARNSLQRGLLPAAGPWGATLVRFLFGLPFTLVAIAVAYALTPGAAPHLGPRFWIAACVGAAAQVGATASLLVSMRRSSFALGTCFQQSSLPMSALIGLVGFGDRLHPMTWAGIALATTGLMVLSWPRHGAKDWSGAWFGLASGCGFGVATNGFRQAGLALDGAHPIFAGIATVGVVQAIQSVALILYMSAKDRPSLLAALRSWKESIFAGLFGSTASAMWFVALALSPAGPVRAINVVEIPFASIAGRRIFKERMDLRQRIAAWITAGGVIMSAMG